MNTRTVLRLFYSRKQENLFARMGNQDVHIYRTMDGRLVEVTEAKESNNPSAFDDAVYLGETLAPGNWIGSRPAKEVDFLYSTTQCDSISPVWGDHCILPHGHGGDHSSTIGTWTFGSSLTPDRRSK